MLIAVSGKKQSGKDTTAAFLRDLISQHTPRYKVSLMAFASPLKRLLSILTGPTRVQVSDMETDHQKENTFPTFVDHPPRIDAIYRTFFDDYNFAEQRAKLATFLGKSEEDLSTTIVEAIQDFLNMVKMSSEPVSVRRSLQWLGTDAFRKRIDAFWVGFMALNALRDIDEGRIVIITDARFLNEMKFVESYGGVSVRVTRPMAAGSKLSQVHASETELDNYAFNYYIPNDKDLKALKINTESVYRRLFSV